MTLRADLYSSRLHPFWQAEVAFVQLHECKQFQASLFRVNRRFLISVYTGETFFLLHYYALLDAAKYIVYLSVHKKRHKYICALIYDNGHQQISQIRF